MRVCLVTGASSGLGRNIAKLLCKKEYIIYIVGRKEEKLLELKKECQNDFGKIKIIVGDLSEKDFRNNLIKFILEKEGQIDYLINNAGFGRGILFEEQEAEDIQKMFNVNVVAYAHLTNLVLKNMKNKNSGRIIHIGSVVPFTPLPYFTIYNSTKAAIYTFNRSLRYELKDTKITSTVVLPARMKTDFAKNAYGCYEESDKENCIQRFNKIAGDSEIVAKNIIKKLDSGKEVITPTLKSKLWYFMRYFGFIVDFGMKHILGPKERAHLEMAKLKHNEGVKK